MAQRTAPILYLRALPDGVTGQALRMELHNRVLGMRYEDEEDKADTLTLTLDNRDNVFNDDPAFRKGMLIEVAWGYPGNMTPTRTCVVTAAKGGRVLTVTAMAK